MEEKDMARIELNEQNLDDVVGGAFGWCVGDDGMTTECRVTEKNNYLGDFTCEPGAKARYNALKLEHKLDGWTCSQYLAVLVNEGMFHRK